MKRLLAAVLILMLVVPVVFVVPEPVEAADAETKLLLHANGTDATTTFKDYSDSGHTVTANGDAQVDTAQSKFGGASALFDGTGDYLSVSDHADFDLTHGDSWTIEAWVRMGAKTSSRMFIDKWISSTGYQFYYRSADDTFTFYANGGIFLTSTTNPSVDTWYHVAVTHDGTTTRLFVNGTQEDSGTGLSLTANATSVDIGRQESGDTLYFQGHMDELRISDTARWTENFTPPTSEYDSGEDIAATGGTITYADGYVIHTFTSSGTFEITAGAEDVEYLVVAGGGGGGGLGGGGAGGYLTGTFARGVGLYTVTVGAAGAASASSAAKGGSGGNSVFDTIASTGGGGGGAYDNTNHSGDNGGSGGGAGIGNSPPYTEGSAGTGILGQGNDGGTQTVDSIVGGGGGGASEVGSNSSGQNGGAGGGGTASSITGSSVTYAGGGGGSGNVGATPGSGGAGGGGAGGVNGGASPVAGTANTGGGGGGGGNKAGAAGGSGVVIVRYEDPRTFAATGGTIIEKDGYIIHTFTSSDTFEVTQGSANVEYLVVGGGGGGASNSGGGGGGGMLAGTVSRGVGSYTVTIGAGGTAGESGDNSVFDTITATGGGGGGLINAHAGRDGGSGGGGSGFNNNAGGSGTAGQGNDGGTGVNSSASTYGGGGGGGAGEVGANAVVGTAGDGGDGLPSSISGTQKYYAGGGGGRGFVSNTPHGSSGGLGGGGDGGAPSSASSAGAANTGGGGGSSGDESGVGGSGIVIVRYLNPEPSREIRLVGVVRLINVRLR